MTEYEAYVDLINNQTENEAYYEAISIYHPNFTKTYYLVVDSVPLTKRLPSGELVTFEPANIVPSNAQNSNDLDQVASFTIGDLENIYDDELENIPLGGDAPSLTYYIYTSEYEYPSESVEYDTKSVAQKKGAFTVKCGAPSLNKDETGEIFDLTRFPMLRGA